MYASAAVELTPDHTENHSGKSNSGRHAGSEEKGIGSFFGKAGIVSVHETVHGTVEGSPGNQGYSGRYQEYSNRCFDYTGHHFRIESCQYRGNKSAEIGICIDTGSCQIGCP